MKKISDITIPSIENIFRKANWLSSVQESVAVYIPQELKSHCAVANFDNGILVFAIESSAWAMKFKYITADLLKQLRTQANLPQLSAIKYYIEPEFLNLFKGAEIMDKRGSRGFTTLELIVAIIFTVGLAGVLIPRFMAQASYARTVAINAMASATRTSVALSVVEYKKSGNVTPAVHVGSELVKVSPSSGYPLGSAEGIGAALKRVDGFVPTYGDTTIFNLANARNNCNVTYQEKTGIVSFNTTGC